MEPNKLKTLFSQPRVIIGSLVTLAAIGGTSTALMQNAPQGVAPRESVNVTATSVPKTDRLSVATNQSPQDPQGPNAKSSTTDLAIGTTDAAKTSDSAADQSGDRKASTPSDSSSSSKDLNKVERCEITMAKISDPNPPANVRSQPNSDSATIVGSLQNGTFVTVVNSNDGWLKISTPTKGWVSKQIALSGCNQKEERVMFAKGSTQTTIADEFIGTGSHTYQMYLLKGQTVRLRSQRGPRPTLVSPQGLEIVATADSAAPWSGKLDQSGDYKIILDSNFKGYKYSFEVVAE
jgi:Bacterial SH3 domain